MWHRFFAVPAFICHFRSYITVRKLLVYTSPNFSSRFCGCMSFYLGKNQEIKKRANRLRQFDTLEPPSVNVFGNDSIFIIIFGSGYSYWREIRGKLYSVTTHRVSGKLNTDLALYAPKLVKNNKSYHNNLRLTFLEQIY